MPGEGVEENESFLKSDLGRVEFKDIWWTVLWTETQGRGLDLRNVDIFTCGAFGLCCG